MRKAILFLVLLFSGSASRAAADAAAVLKSLTAAGAAAARPLGSPTLGKVSWSRIEGSVVKAKLELPLEAASPLVKWMATDPEVDFAGTTFGANAGELAVPLPAKGGPPRTLRAANISLEIALGHKDAAADKRKALAFGLVRRVLSSEADRVKAGTALQFKQVTLGPAGVCHVEARAATVDALVLGLQRLGGEAPLPPPTSGTGAGGPPAPAAVRLSAVKTTRLVRDSESGVDGLAVTFDAVVAPPGGASQDFASLALAFQLADGLPKMHADLGQPEVGAVQELRFSDGAVLVRFISSLIKVPALVKKLEDYPGIAANDTMLLYGLMTKQHEYVDASGARRYFGRAMVSVIFRTTTKPGAPKPGALTKAVETLDRVFGSSGQEFMFVQRIDPPPVAGASPPPPPLPEPPSRPSIRDARIINGALTMKCLFRTADQKKKAIEDLGRGGFTAITVDKESEQPYRDKRVIEADVKATLPATP